MAEYQSAYTGLQIDAGIAKANTAAQPADLINKQDTLVSGTNIKTINNESILGSGNIDIQDGGSDFNVREIDASDPTQWDGEKMTDAVIADIIDNEYTALHLINVDLGDLIVDGWMFALNNAVMTDQNITARYFYHFDEGDEEEGTSPNIETWQCIKTPDGSDGYDYQVVIEQYEFGEKNNVAVYSANFDISQGSPTLTQEDMANIWTNKPDIIRLTAGTTTTVGNKSREDADTAQVIYSSTVMEGTTPTVYIITITYDEPNSQYVFEMNTYQLSAGA